MKTRMMLIGTFLASSLFAGGAALASPGDHSEAARFVIPARGEIIVWDSLGELTVGGRRNAAATIEVRRNADRLERLRVVVKRGDLGMKTIRVTFGNGRDLVTTMTGRTALIDLPGDARKVRSIEIVSNARGWRKQPAVVEVLADAKRDRYPAPRPIVRDHRDDRDDRGPRGPYANR